MTPYVADTHALFWYLTSSPRLGDAAKAAFEEAARGEAVVLIPSIVIAELYYLNEKAGSPIDFADEYRRLASAGQFTFIPLTADDVAEFDRDRAVAEMHDRIIVGVARRHACPCITRDAQVNGAGVATVW